MNDKAPVFLKSEINTYPSRLNRAASTTRRHLWQLGHGWIPSMNSALSSVYLYLFPLLRPQLRIDLAFPFCDRRLLIWTRSRHLGCGACCIQNCLAQLVRFLVVKLTYLDLNSKFNMMLHLWLIILSVKDNVSVDSETLLTTDFVDLKIKPT
jgi:hypothetical protein